ncbi:Outer membrane protein TolC [Flavobacterium succinicans]|jgi:outer membrane protein TolC|uniref:Outer membrane protein TolC n=1 Tax=Flavobacterium succinicans TaxID=29536 RepID=A0A1I4W6C3_9FLAO|nr:TolC family protein [Flavobacterium succinicans]SFN09168.1 Outer membrane protein TolC [Flavobacterium succinicans]
MRKNIIAFLLLLLCGPWVYCQDVLTIQDAVAIALENNFEIKIAKNSLSIDKVNVSEGNAGMLPSLTGSFIDNNRIQNTSQTLQSGQVNSLKDAKNNSMNYGVSLDWTVFDGLRMFARYDQLKELQKLGEAKLKQTILSKIGAVNATYFDLVQQQQQLIAIDSTLLISTQRLQLAENRFKIGKASKLEVLNAQVDLNTDKVALLRQKELYANTKIKLNQILARDAQTSFSVLNDVIVDNSLILNELNDLAKKQNPQLQSQIIAKNISELQLKQVKAARYPVISLNSGYNFQNTESSLGFTTESSARGFNYGFTATLNIFDGFAQNRNEKIAKLEIENTKLAIEQQTQALESQLSTFYQTYLTNLELVTLEENNEAIAKQNLAITIDKLKIGTITTIEFRAAQLNYVNARVRNSNAQYQAKLSEIALKELAGTISY